MSTACIEGRDYPYSIDANDGTYHFDIDGHRYRFRQWTWGEKNRVADAAIDATKGRLRVNVARFNELMLATTLMETDALASITPDSLGGLNPVLGDTLLAIAFWVNELPDEEKKASLPPSAAASRTAT